MKNYIIPLLVLFSLPLLASGRPGDDKNFQEFGDQKAPASPLYHENRQGDYEPDDDDDVYPFQYTDEQPLPFSGVNSPPAHICVETPDDDSQAIWPVAESAEKAFQDEIDRLRRMNLESQHVQTFKSDWEKLQEVASQSMFRKAPDTTTRLNLDEFVQMAKKPTAISTAGSSKSSIQSPKTAALKDSPPSPEKYKPLRRRPKPKTRDKAYKRNQYNLRMLMCSGRPDILTIGQNQFNLERFEKEISQLRHSLCEALKSRSTLKDESEISKKENLIKRIRDLIAVKIDAKEKEAKRITLEGYLSQYLNITPEIHPTQRLSKAQISNGTPKLSSLGKECTTEDIPLKESTLIDDLPYYSSDDTDVDSPPVARRTQLVKD